MIHGWIGRMGLGIFSDPFLYPRDLSEKKSAGIFGAVF